MPWLGTPFIKTACSTEIPEPISTAVLDANDAGVEVRANLAKLDRRWFRSVGLDDAQRRHNFLKRLFGGAVFCHRGRFSSRYIVLRDRRAGVNHKAENESNRNAKSADFLWPFEAAMRTSLYRIAMLLLAFFAGNERHGYAFRINIWTSYIVYIPAAPFRKNNHATMF
jgi:hypothetical protein